MAYQNLNPTETILRAEDKLVSLSGEIFRDRKFSAQEENIWKAAQINVGLFALTSLTPDQLAYQQIIVGLNALLDSDQVWP
jgi:hypothetical protein